METTIKKLAALILLLYAPLAYGGGVRYVSITGHTDSSGTTQAKAWDLLTANDSLGTGGIDTIKIYSGTYNQDLFQEHNGNDPDMLVYMAATDTSFPIIAGKAGGTDYGGWDNREICKITGNYVKLYRLGFVNSDYGTGGLTIYWITLAGTYGIMDRCYVTAWISDVRDAYWVHGYYERGIVVSGEHCTIMNTKVFRVPDMGIVINGEGGTNITLYRDTVSNTGGSSVTLTNHGHDGAGYRGHLVEQCYLDTTWEEDNIQFDGHLNDSSGQMLVRNTVMKNAGENAFDPKGGWRSTVEGCVVFGTLGDDNGDTDGYIGGDAHDATGPAFCGSNDSHEWGMIYRNNVLYSNSSGMQSYGLAAFYHNTLANNRRMYNTSSAPNGQHNIRGTPKYQTATSTESYIWILNNISVGMPNDGGTDEAVTGGTLLAAPDLSTGSTFGTGTPATVALNGNLYYESPETMSGLSRFFGYIDYTTEPVNDIYQGLTAWRAYATATICAGAEDSSLEGNPDFVNALVYPTSWGASYDWRLKSTSIGHNKAVALAKITTGAISATQTIGLSTNLFRDDYGVGLVWGTGITIKGDSLLIGNNSDGYDLVQISSINHTAGTITLLSSITTATNDRIYFWQNGTMWNDIGANAPLSITGTGEDPPPIPDTTTQVAPTNESTQSQPIIFKWLAVPGATKYWLTVASPTWDPIYVNNYTITDTCDTVSGLPYNTEMYWNMAVGNESGWNTDAWVNWWTFTTAAGPTFDQSVVVDWSNRLTADTLTDNALISFSNIQQRDVILILFNPLGKNVSWPAGVTWEGLTTPPQPLMADTSIYWFIQHLGHVYGVQITAPIGGSSASGASEQWVTQNFVPLTSRSSGAGVPLDVNGSDGDIYWDTTNLFLYIKAGGVWRQQP